MKRADVLSQRPDHDSGRSDNDKKILLKEERFRSVTMNKGEFWKEIEEAEEFVKEEIRVAVDEKREGWKREGKVFIWKERIYVPDSATLHEEIL